MVYGFNESIFNCFISIAICFLLSVTYVTSLYVWKSQNDRNHPTTIKQRFFSVFIMMFIAPLFLYSGLNNELLQQHGLFKLMGFRTKGLLQASLLPLVLTMVLFLGPLYLQFLNGSLATYMSPSYWITNSKNLIWLRNHVVAPLSEEFTFRSCMLPMILQCFSPLAAVFICPLFFGVAHYHHMIERMRFGDGFKSAFMISCFQFSFTTVFGIYSAYIYLKTGHLMSTFIVHAFCNHMGMPNVSELQNYHGKERLKIISLHVLGLILWCCLLNPLTEPTLYSNDLFS